MTICLILASRRVDRWFDNLKTKPWRQRRKADGGRIMY
jgi:hypothetical protein